jgi:DNA repair protein SbcD/Mre11
MSRKSFRFLHAADLRLHEPFTGVVDAPEDLLERLIECPYVAASRVFDAALNQNVDFVVLAGGIVDFSKCSAHELLFLTTEFQRLADRAIPVYWFEDDLATFAEMQLERPSNVRMLQVGAAAICHEVGGMPICEILAFDEKAPRGRSDLFRLAVGNVDRPPEGDVSLANYLALGGRHERATPLRSANFVAHCPGTPQGRNSNETGAHGCSIVNVDEQAAVQISPLACDAVRWHCPKVELPPDADRTDLEALLNRRTTEIVEGAAGVISLIRWHVQCGGRLFSQLRRGKLVTELLANLRANVGSGNRALWISEIRVELPQHLPIHWQEEESLRGDFVRLFVSTLDDTQRDLENFILQSAPPELLEMVPSDRLYRSDEHARAALLADAVWKGAEMLAPEDGEA